MQQKTCISSTKSSARKW